MILYADESNDFFPVLGPNDTYCWCDQLAKTMNFFGFDHQTGNNFYYKPAGSSINCFKNLPATYTSGIGFDLDIAMHPGLLLPRPGYP